MEKPHSDFFWLIWLLACTDHFSRLTPVRREAPYPEVTGRGRGETPTECEIRHVIERQGERQGEHWGEHWGGKSVENPHSDFFWPIRLLACTDHFSRLTPPCEEGGPLPRGDRSWEGGAPLPSVKRRPSVPPAVLKRQLESSRTQVMDPMSGFQRLQRCTKAP